MTSYNREIQFGSSLQVGRDENNVFNIHLKLPKEQASWCGILCPKNKITSPHELPLSLVPNGVKVEILQCKKSRKCSALPVDPKCNVMALSKGYTPNRLVHQISSASPLFSTKKRTIFGFRPQFWILVTISISVPARHMTRPTG